MQSSNIPDASPWYLRTEGTIRHLDIKSSDEIIKIKVGGAVRYCKIMTGRVTNFRTGSWISVGASRDPTREVIYFNPESIDLKEKYEELKKTLSPPITQSEIIQKVISFVRNTFRSTTDKYIAQVVEIQKKHSSGMHGRQPIVHLNTFIEKKIGVCRHQALFLAYLLDSLKADGRLRPGKIYHHRDIITSDGIEDGHTWVMYHEDNGKLHWIDSSFNLHLIFLERKDLLIRLYGIKAISNCEVRYLPPPMPDFAPIPSPATFLPSAPAAHPNGSPASAISNVSTEAKPGFFQKAGATLGEFFKRNEGALVCGVLMAAAAGALSVLTFGLAPLFVGLCVAGGLLVGGVGGHKFCDEYRAKKAPISDSAVMSDTSVLGANSPHRHSAFAGRSRETASLLRATETPGRGRATASGSLFGSSSAAGKQIVPVPSRLAPITPFPYNGKH